MNTNIKFKKVKTYRVSQEKLRNKALSKGVNLIAPETIFLSNDTLFGKNVTIEPYVVIGGKVPVVITSRADDAEARLASIAAAVVAL